MLNLGQFNNIGINAMGSCVKSTIRAPVAFFLSRFTLWATMSVHTIWVVAVQSESTWSHAGNRRQDEIVILAQFSRVIMMASFVGTFTL